MCYTKQKKCKNIDYKSQISRNSDKNCQENENNVMWSVTKEIGVWLPKPTLLHKCRRLCSDKHCQSTKYLKEKSPRRPVYSYDKNCQ